jgi:hypothetical protein
MNDGGNVELLGAGLGEGEMGGWREGADEDTGRKVDFLEALVGKP